MGRVVSYNEDAPRCAFCGKTEWEVHKLVAGPSASICDECIDLCVEIINEDRRRTDDAPMPAPPRPAEINAYLDRYVIGQAAAKRTLSVAVYNHYRRIGIESDERARESGAMPASPGSAGASDRRSRDDDDRLDDVEIAKSNVLLLGPTGVGKTYLARVLARIMDVPFVITDATTLTEAGYVGDDVETVLQRLIEAADGDVARAQHGIVYIDEIDKIARKSGENTSITRDVSGEGVQQALLKILEGTVASVPTEGTRKHREQETIRIDTRDILFICGGAFVGLDDIIRRRIGAHASGFAAPWRSGRIPDAQVLRQVSADDLAEFGLLPEFIGRLPIVSVLDELDENDLSDVLVRPRNALTRQYRKMFAAEGIDLRFTDEAVHAIAATAVNRGVGARGLRSIIEHALEDTMFALPDLHDVRQVIVDRACIEDGGAPKLVGR